MVLVRREAATIVGYLAFVAMLLFGAGLKPGVAGAPIGGLVGLVLCAIMLWLSFAVVRHAECLAVLLGEPLGTLILTLSVIVIEVALISAVMITGDERPALARDTMFSVVMIVLNGLVGLSLLMGGLRHRFQHYNLQGANAYLAVLIPLAVLTLILPRFTASAPGGEPSTLQAAFLLGMSVVLYSVFLAIQTRTHSDIFKPTATDGTVLADDGHEHLVVASVPFHTVALIAAMLPIVLLSKNLAVYIEHGIGTVGLPAALGGFLIAALVLTPEALGAIHAARANQLQRAVNLCLGSALATIGLTVPAVLTIGWVTGKPVELALESPDIVMLSVTLVVSLVTFVSGRTSFLLGVVHLALFAAYVMMIFDRPVAGVTAGP